MTATSQWLLIVMVALLVMCFSQGAEIPVAWCNNRYGMRTRTTGECICKQDCVGPACRREQGMVFFSFKECPSCECIKKSAATDNADTAAGDRSTSSSSSSGKDDAHVEEDDAPVVQRGKPKNREQRYYSGDDPLEIEGNFYEWTIDNWRGIMAAFTALGLVTMVIPLMLLGMGSNSQQVRRSTGEGVTRTSSGVNDNKAVSTNDSVITSTTDKIGTPRKTKATNSGIAGDDTSKND